MYWSVFGFPPLSHRGRLRCRWRRCTTSTQRKKMSLVSRQEMSLKWWIARTPLGGKGGCGGKWVCFLPTTQQRSCEKTPQATHLLCLHTFTDSLCRCNGPECASFFFFFYTEAVSDSSNLCTAYRHFISTLVSKWVSQFVFSDHIRIYTNYLVLCLFGFYWTYLFIKEQRHILKQELLQMTSVLQHVCQHIYLLVCLLYQ